MNVLAVSAALEAVGGFLVLGVGYGTVWALWHFIFKERKEDD
jgi:hypothetical protein